MSCSPLTLFYVRIFNVIILISASYKNLLGCSSAKTQLSFLLRHRGLYVVSHKIYRLRLYFVRVEVLREKVPQSYGIFSLNLSLMGLLYGG